MEKLHGDDFVRVRPFGSLGDKGCDGYLSSNGQVFQCFGKLEDAALKVAVLIEKIGNDYNLAAAHLTAIMKEWHFAHNLVNGFPVEAVELIEKMKTSHPEHQFGTIGPAGLEDRVFQLSEADLFELLGPVATAEDSRNLQITEVRDLVRCFRAVDWHRGGAPAEISSRRSNALKLREDLANFRVLDSYREMSDRAARCRLEMLAIERRAVSHKQTLSYLRSALEDERPPQLSDLSRLYAAVGIELPESAKRRFDEVKAFHESVIANRRVRLQGEIAEVELQISGGEQRSSALDEERSQTLKFLDGHGAFEDFIALQEQLAVLEVEAASLRDRFAAAEMLEGKKTQLDIDRANIKQRLQDDYHARKGQLNRAVLFIGRVITELYQDRTGEFLVDATDNGPEFRITIQGDRGGGISQMEIFCLDLALFFITGKENRGPKFLIHDSHLFDGVDERQIAQALRLGNATATDIGGQYIVTMNSDIFDRLPLPSKMDRSKIVLTPRLSDESEAGGLFGFRFD